ncbi:MAG: nitroreductase family protein [Candidatus Thiodiazotropha sp.]
MNNKVTFNTLPSYADRTAAHPISELFLQRWSPRSFEPVSMPESDLLMMLEAARWAPSAFNIQPWRFIYTMRGDANWQDWLELLDPFNASWASNASALVFLVSDSLTPASNEHPAKPSTTHSFDAGAAWAHLALQATASGYQAHAMAGIHFDKIRQQLGVPDHYRVEIGVAIGRQAAPSRLPQVLREREFPSSRLLLQQIAFRGLFVTSERRDEANRGGAEQ